MSEPIAWDLVRQGLWVNSRDALRHAIEHVRELNENNRHAAHHLKWLVISVHQAAECLCNIFLIQFDPSHPSLTKKGETWLPAMSYTAEELLKEPLNQNLTLGERRILALIAQLPAIRNRLIHRTLPDSLDASTAATALLGLLRLVRKHFEDPIPEFESDYPRPEAVVFSAIPYRRVDEYIHLASQLLREEFPTQDLGCCGNCGVNSIVGRYCEICFEEMDLFECSHCGAEEFIPSWEWKAQSRTLTECPSCGERLA